MSHIRGQFDPNERSSEPAAGDQGNSTDEYRQDEIQAQSGITDTGKYQPQNSQAHLNYVAPRVQPGVEVSYTAADMEACLLATEIETNSSLFEGVKKLFRCWDKNQWVQYAKQLAKEKLQLAEEKAQLKQKLDHSSRMLLSKSSEVSKGSEAYQILLRERNGLHNEVLDMRQNQDKCFRDWQNREAAYEESIETLQRRDEELGKKVQDAQRAAQVMMDQNKSFAMSDDEIRAQFKARADSWYGWAKDFAYRKLTSINQPDEDDHNELLESLPRFTKLHNGKLPEELIRGRKPNSVPYLLLHAMLADFISTEIFATPYWILKASADLIRKDGKPHNSSDLGMRDETLDFHGASAETSRSEIDIGLSLAESISDLLDFLTTLHERDAQQWRSQMVRFFLLNGMGDPLSDSTKSTKSTDRSVPKSLQERVIVARSQYARILTQNFVNGSARFLLDPTITDARGGRLEEEINLAMQLSARLWSQRSRVGCLDLQVFHNTAFSASADYLEAHQSQEKDIDPPNFYDGLPVGIVVQPAIVAFGTEEGQGYSAISRVWLKARVWVDRTGARRQEAEHARQRQAEEAHLNVFWQ